MKNYKAILRLLIKDILKKREKKQALIFILLGIFYVMIALLVVSLVAILSPVAVEADCRAEFITFVLFTDFAVTIFFGTLAAMSFLFMSKDSEFFKTLPVRESEVFLAKLTIVYLTEALLSALLLIPALICGGVMMNLPPLFFCLIPVFALAVPVFALLFIALISLPFMYLISKLKNRGAVSSIIVVLIFTVCFGIYMYFVLSANPALNGSLDGSHGTDGSDSGGADGITTNTNDYTSFLNTVKIISYIFYPIFMLVKFSVKSPVFGLQTTAGMAVSLSIFIVSLAVFFALAYFLSMLVYRKATSKLLENHARVGVTARNHATSSSLWALVKLEWRQIIRNPSAAMQIISAIVLCPLLVIFLSIMVGNMTTSITVAENMTVDLAPVVWIIGMISVLMFGVGINAGAATCISREGRSFNSLKAMPLSAKTIIKAKKLTYLIISGVSIISGFAAMSGIMIYFGTFLWWIPVGGLPVCLVWLSAITDLSIYGDLKKPKLDWKSFREVLKRGKNNLFSILWVISCMILGAILVFFAIAGVFTNAPLMIGIGYIILGGIGVGVGAIARSRLEKNSENLFRMIHA